PPTTTGKLLGGFKVENGPGDLIRVETYPGFAGTIQLPSAVRDVVVSDNDVVEVLPLRSRDDTILVRAITNTPAPPGDSPNNAVATIGAGGSANKAAATNNAIGPVGSTQNSEAISPDGTRYSAIARRTNILAFDVLGKQIANIEATTMPSWQRFDEGKV